MGWEKNVMRHAKRLLEGHKEPWRAACVPRHIPSCTELWKRTGPVCMGTCRRQSILVGTLIPRAAERWWYTDPNCKCC